MAKHAGGRPPGPTKLTPKFVKKFCGLVSNGVFLETASIACDVDYSTVRRWMAAGRKSQSGVLYEFLRSVKRAMATAEIKYQRALTLEKGGAWTRFAWLLERRFRDRWAKREAPPPKETTKDPVSLDQIKKEIEEVLATNGNQRQTDEPS